MAAKSKRKGESKSARIRAAVRARPGITGAELVLKTGLPNDFASTICAQRVRRGEFVGSWAEGLTLNADYQRGAHLPPKVRGFRAEARANRRVKRGRDRPDDRLVLSQGLATSDSLPRPARAVQVGGFHYMSMAIQPWDAMQAWFTPEEFAGFLRGNAIKYLARAPRKGGGEDYRKAAHYLQRLIELVQPAGHKGAA